MSDKIEIEVKSSKIILEQGDITKQTTEAIVNAANSSLRGGSGVDGAIHRAGGPKIMEECRKIGGCPAGEAVITTGGKLKTKYVIHTVGPIWKGGNAREEETLSRTYQNSLALASKKGIRSLSFPSISTGAYGYPLREASKVALNTIADYLKKHPEIEKVVVVLFSDRDFQVYQETLKEIGLL